MVRLADAISGKYYKTGDGKYHLITEMKDDFLKRAIEFLERKAETKIKAGTPDKYVFPDVYASLLNEQQRRTYAEVSRCN